MPITNVQSPDGRIIKVEHPAGASQDQIIAYAKTQGMGLMSAPSLQQPQREPMLAEGESIPKRLWGAVEAPLAMASGMAAGMASMPVAGLAAAGDIALRGIAGLQEPSPSAEIVDKYTMEGYQPRTQTGQRILGAMTAPFRKLDEMTTIGAENVQDALLQAQQETGRTLEGYPEITAALATGVKFAPDFIAGLLGIRLPRTPAARARDVRGVERQAGEMGLNLRAPYPEQVEQAAQFAERRFDPGVSGTEGLEGVPSAIGRERDVQSNRIGSQFREAEQMGAQVPSRTAGGLAENMRSAVSPYITENMPSVNRLLERADKFGFPSQGSVQEALGVRYSAKVPVSDIFKFRQQINANLPSDFRSPEYAALSAMKGEVDRYLTSTVVNDLVSGNPQAISKYQDAVTQWADFKDLFDGNRIVKKLQEDQATPEQVKSLIIGMNAANAPRQAANVVTRLEAILGSDSPEFRSIQNSVMTDLLAPAIDVEPNFGKAVSNIERFLKRNPTLARELLGQQTVRELQSFQSFARAIDKTAPISEKIKAAGFDRIAGVLAAGNELSKSALRVSLVSRIVGALKPNMGDARKNAVLSEVLGYNPRQSLFTVRPVANVAAMEEFRTVPEEPQALLQSMRGGQ